ncbi:hypothetical protein IW140_001126 [Coemansia sp. RSA 1813]|nr:hypothetical protein EV178_002351 [Coemansia sp. RSA 1646]KAJ1773156.1 hypothetical protein LPJ74_000895 [Coemansia sp. RSA 1843]KAJ2092034.1 hypothetical protein IW138_001400 [Coemansia sp. RSA 986]KAJ2216630.1 hypothetical protein EV179_001169 [Coemansia sp. RSA 487]KAJ2572086.1 hypothetical protein IW140_001126 [Coemansia sp. RSA 1813]
MASGSLKLAQEYAKEAQKASKSSWFSKPEWDTAAQYWDKAATVYKTALHFEEAIDCHAKASDAFTKVNALYLAAKGYENAAMIAEKQLKDHSKAVMYYSKSSDMFRSQGSSPERAAEMLEKAAKICEDVDTIQAIQLYDTALGIYEAEDRGRFSMGTFKKLTSYLIGKSRLPEAADVQMRLYAVCEQINNRYEGNKCCLAVVVLLLAFGDNVAASKKMDEFGQSVSLIHSDEFALADQMLQAYTNGDQEEFANLARSQKVTFLDSSISRLAVKTRVPGAARVEQPPSLPQMTTPGGAAASSSVHAGSSHTTPAPSAMSQNNSGSTRTGSAVPPAPPVDDDDDLL